MEAIVKKWGNSLGVRFPKVYADETGIQNGSLINISVNNGAIIIEPILSKDMSLEEMLKQITPDNMHSEITSDVRGKEVW